MKITTKAAIQVHSVPEHAVEAIGPFPPEVLADPVIVYDYKPALSEDGGDFAPGATAQNNFRPPKYLRCGNCLARVLDTETSNHKCEEDDGE
jgi:hypothetical protein